MAETEKIDKKNIEDILPLTAMQEGMLFHYLKDPDSEEYVEQLSLHFEGICNPSILSRAWGLLVARHPMLRVVFRWKGIADPVQIVLKQFDPEIQLFPNSDDKNLDTWRDADIQRGFDLQLSCHRLTFFETGSQSFTWVISNHHIIYDGWSNSIILKELLKIYHNLLKNETPVLKPPGVFRDFIKWTQKLDKAAHKTFWKAALHEYHPVSSYQLGNNSKRENKIQKKEHRFHLLPKTVDDINQAVSNFRCTPSVIFYTAWGLLLQEYLQTDDIAFGTTESGRPPEIAGVEETVGLFINTPPLRFRTSNKTTVSELLTAVQQQLIQRQPFINTPLVEIKEAAGIREDLFDTICVIENYPLSELLNNKSLSFQFKDFKITEQTNFDLTLSISLTPTCSLTISYEPTRFSFPFVKRLEGHLRQIIDYILYQPEGLVKEIKPIHGPEEKTLKIGNTTLSDKKDSLIHNLVEEQVQKTPHSPAIVFKNQSISFDQINQKANQVAHTLIQKGISSGDITAMLCSRSINRVASTIGILKAGSVFLPLSEEWPLHRIKVILEDAKPKVLIVDQEWVEDFSPAWKNFPELEILILDQSESWCDSSPIDNPGITLSSTSLAYIIYTSGTTGHPKGVMMEHRNLVNFCLWLGNHYQIGPGCHYIQLINYTFDPSLGDLFTTLIFGGTLFIPERDDILDVKKMRDFIRKNNIHILNTVPSMIKAYLAETDEFFPSINTLISGGETLTEDLKEELLHKGYRLFNHYGPTEATVDCMWTECHPEIPVSIGIPIQNMQAWVVNRHNCLLPKGIPGELVLAGAGLAQGYWGDPHLTKEKFISPGWANGNPIYKTGDWVRQEEDGSMIFLGRIDRQVKIRGMRVEIGEIENTLRKIPSIKDAAVVDKIDTNGFVILAAFVTANDKLDFQMLKGTLRQQLPSYMVPEQFLQVTEIPLTSNGKIDTNKLKSLTFEKKRQAVIEAESDLEIRIAAIWKDLLKVDTVGLHDNFFDLGGNSLYIIRLVGKLQTAFNIDIPVTKLFAYPSVKEFALWLKEQLDPSNKDKQVFLSGEKKIWQQNKKGIPSDSRSSTAPIAIIGMACHFPGAKTVEEFWKNLETGTESISFFTQSELQSYGISKENIQSKNYIKAKGALDDIDQFDPDFFGYSEREAHLMDPQFRRLIQCSWHALEDAAVVPENEVGHIGIYTGSDLNLRWLSQYLQDERNPAELYALSNLNDPGTYASAIAYRFNLTGPAVTLQTACSTSLVAIHTAARAIRNGECDIALAGGASISLPQKSGYTYQEGMIFSPDGHCRTFDKRAQGTVNGDGVGMIVLKPLEDALRDNNHIYAVIRESVINNDGNRKVGYTAPSVQGQAEAIHATHVNSGISAETITCIEAHGTGTALGDPIEIESLMESFHVDRKQFCAIGSVKSNLGHLDAAAGVAGIIKMSLAIKKRKIPASLHYYEPNPEINFKNSPFFVPTKTIPWNTDQIPRRGGVSSFGIGGTNAHALLEEAPEIQTTQSKTPNILLFSARNSQALRLQLAHFRSHLLRYPDINLSNVAFTLATGRRHFSHRQIIQARDIDDALRQTLYVREHYSSTSVKFAFLFSGQGNEFAGMFQDLLTSIPLFRHHVKHCLEILGWDEQTLNFNPEDPEQEEYIQPMLFIFQYALGSLLMDYHIQPTYWLGHSFGEYAAACLAGVIRLPDALAIVVYRAKLMTNLPSGGMMSIKMNEQDLLQILPRGLTLSAINSHDHCTVSGDHKTLIEFQEFLMTQGIPSKVLSAKKAFHSHHVDPIQEPFLERLRTIEFNTSRQTIISTSTGKALDPTLITNPTYWANQMRQPVQFFAAVNQMLEEPDLNIIEIGPGDGLKSFIKKNSAFTKQHHYIEATNQKAEADFFYKQLGVMWQYGGTPDWKKIFDGQKPKTIPLPGYPFSSKTFWPKQGLLSIDNIQSPEIESECDWFYEPVWKQITPLPIEENITQSWAFITKNTCFTPLIQKLTDQGNTIETYISIPSLATWPERIVYTLSYDSFDIETAFYVLLELAKKIPASEKKTRIDLICSGVFSVTAEDNPDPKKAIILGPASIIPLEFPHLEVKLVDINPEEKQVMESLLETLINPHYPSRIALRSGWTWVMDWKLKPRTNDPEPTALTIKDGSVYLITGANRGIGQEIATYLLSKGDVKLALLSRNSFENSDFQEDNIMKIIADVTNQEQLENALNKVQHSWGKIDGVFHCAGIPDGGLISMRPRSLSEQVMAPKIEGTLLLDNILSQAPPQFCILFSSLNNLIPSPGQVAYQAANEFLDAFAQQAGKKTKYISILWDRWKETGMAVNNRTQEIKTSLSHTIWNSYTKESNGRITFTGNLNFDKHWMLHEHTLEGKGILPATAQLDLVCAAFNLSEKTETIELQEVYFINPCIIPPGTTQDISLTFKPSANVFNFELTDKLGNMVCSGNIQPVKEIADKHKSISALKEPFKNADVSVPEEKSPKNGHLKYGDRWNNFKEIWTSSGKMLSHLKLSPNYTNEVEEFRLHPALLDTALMSFQLSEWHQEFLPFGCKKITIKKQIPAEIYSFIRQQTSFDDHSTATELNVEIYDQAGNNIVDIEGLQLVRPTWKKSKTATSKNLALKLKRPGDFSSFEAIECPTKRLKPGEVKIAVTAVGLNFKDVLAGFTLVDSQPGYGYECVGRVIELGPEVTSVKTGTSVIALTHPVMQKTIVLSEQQIYSIPPNLSTEEAASTLVAYTTAWYALIDLGGLKKGERVLIHAATGGVGLAAIEIAKLIGAEIYATAGSEEKRDWLKSKKNITTVMNSRKSGYAKKIIHVTQGKGVDLILNSLHGTLMEENFEALKPRGRFVEIGMRDIQSNHPLPMRCFQQGIAYFALGEMGIDQEREISLNILELIRKDLLPPLPIEKFDIEKVDIAFSQLKEAKHIGKLVVNMNTLEALRKEIKKPTEKILQEEGLTTAEGLITLERILKKPSSVVAVSQRYLNSLREQALKSTNSPFPTRKEPGKVTQSPSLNLNLEKELQEIIKTFFGMKQVGLDDNIFELGASSLDVLQMSSRIADRFNIEISPTSLFNYPTIRLLAKQMGAENDSPSTILKKNNIVEKANNRKARLKIRKNKI